MLSRDVTLSTFRESMSVDNFDGIKKAHQRLFTGRMDDRYGHPVALFHQELALLQQRLQTLDAQVRTGQDWSNPERPEPKEFNTDLVRAARKYFGKVRACYGSENEQWPQIREFFEWIFGEKIEEQKRSSVCSESKLGSKGKGSKGVNVADAVWGNHVILEVKNTTGLAGDASLQAAVWYAKHCITLKEGKFEHSKLPVILVGVMGNVLEISIAVCLEEVIVDKILHFEVLNGHDQDETVVKLALIASALKTCAGKLRREYANLERTSERAEEETWHLPCPSATPRSPNSLVSAVKFKAKLSRSNEELIKLKGENVEMRSLFLATYCEQEVVVKFAMTYNESAHFALADQNLAPKLHLCEQVIGGLKMVVMDRVHGKRMCDESKNGLPRKVFDDLEKALTIIHDKDVVFGDLRDTNVMITKSDVEVEAKLIDFDWADEDGKGRYPALINTELIDEEELSPDVGPCKLMCKKHDKYALSKLISTYCNETTYISTKCEELKR
ncbi:hypothetical protein ACEPAH_9323 [Sanghuangporus vaninii]